MAGEPAGVVRGNGSPLLSEVKTSKQSSAFQKKLGLTKRYAYLLCS